jgi:hypothetical protein
METLLGGKDYDWKDATVTVLLSAESLAEDSSHLSPVYASCAESHKWRLCWEKMKFTETPLPGG